VRRIGFGILIEGYDTNVDPDEFKTDVYEKFSEHFGDKFPELIERLEWTSELFKSEFFQFY